MASNTPKLKPGDRIQLTAWTIGGWKGRGTVVAHTGEVVQFRKDDQPDTFLADYCFAMRYECRKVRTA